MRRRFFETNVLSLFLLGIGLSFPLQIIFLFDLPITEVHAVFTKLTPLNFGLMALATWTAYLVFQVSPLIRLAMPIFLVALTWNNALVAHANVNYSPILATMATLFVFMASAVLLRRNIQNVLDNPGMRWWRTERRTRVQITARLRPVTGGDLETETFDLNLGGAFFPMRTVRWGSEGVTYPKKLRVGARCTVRLNIDQLRIVHCHAEIVRKTRSHKGLYPSGFAVRFLNMDGEDQKILGQFLDQYNGAALTQAAA